MVKGEFKNLGETLFDGIKENEYLNELYQKLLIGYSNKLFDIPFYPLTEKEIKDSLRFADILSKSNVENLSGEHMVWAQELILLLNELIPNNKYLAPYTKSVLQQCTNYTALNRKNLDCNFDFLTELDSNIKKQYLKVPFHNDEHFFKEQKEIFDNLNDGDYSYSAPTSMGKSYIMRVFIRNKIENGDLSNFAIIVPTKALINEVKGKIINELKTILSDKNYRVVTSAEDIFVEQDHNFIFIMTPERLLYLTKSSPHIDIDYLFIDEAHKICTTDPRSIFYFKIIDVLTKRAKTPFIYFSSPNIPNPNVFESLIPTKRLNSTAIKYAPVSQFKYIYDSGTKEVSVFNDYTKTFTSIGCIPKTTTIKDFIETVTKPDKQTIVYCSSVARAVEGANAYAETLSNKNDKELDEISNEIKKQIHEDYYLVDLIKKGVAFHVGYLPANIKLRIENAFKKKIIKVMFCTSTLIEGVNFPADNLIVTNNKNGNKKMDPVTFRNLIGRVGRLEFSCFGNVFLYKGDEKLKIEKLQEMLNTPIKDQQLSLDLLGEKCKSSIVTSLANKDLSLSNKPPSTTENEYQLMRKASMLLVDDLVNEKSDSYIVKSLINTKDEKMKNDIINNFKNRSNNSSFEIDYDQYDRLKVAIENGLEYPQPSHNGVDGSLGFDHTAVVNFLEILYDIFNWETYEKSTFKSKNVLKYYAVLIVEWMNGDNLNFILKKALDYREQYPNYPLYFCGRKVADSFEKNNVVHKNYVLVDTLNLIENMVMFTVSNYFRIFSTEFKRHHGITSHFENDWNEYIEYGTKNSIQITLQRCGFSRESAKYILKSKSKFIIEGASSSYKFVIRKNELMSCNDEMVKSEAEDIMINSPDLFVE